MFRNGELRVSRLHSAKFVFNIKTCISFFIRGLPLISAFTSLRASLPEHLEAVAADNMGAFITMSEMVLHLDTIFCTASQAQASRSHRLSVAVAPVPPPLSSAVPTPVVEPPSRVAKVPLTCGNCKSRGLRFTGHIDSTCFQPGGGMEGRREEYLNNKGRIHAMLAECLDNASCFSDSLDAHCSPSTSPLLPPVLDDDIILPTIANLCVPTFSPNTDFVFDLYSPRDPSFPFSLPRALPAVDFQNSALVSLVSLYNAILDSGCTHHIIRDRALFCNYTAWSISVGTANCGSLEALGTGDVAFRCPFGDRHVTFTLRACLYAPLAPINLLSVGALAEHGMSCLFSPDGVMKVSYSLDHPTL